MATQLWFAVAVGRGNALTAYLKGPYGSVADFKKANPPEPDGEVIVIGNSSGYTSQDAAQKEVDHFNNSSPGSKVDQAHESSFPHLPNVLSGIDAIGNFFNKLGEKELWIRVAEVALGLLLIGVALGKLSGLDAKITKAVNSAVKVA